ncbi:hypothetical protein ADL02_16580 [Streptomyces sp. NRRL WC-3723]|nr:hypothetical protein ADL02_16580 [Streptomyces sp. NRRL WC-3723]
MVPRVAAVVPATLGIGMLAGRIRRVAEAATVNTNAWYVLTNRNSGKALDVSGASTAEAAGDSTADSSDDAQGMARLRAPRPIGRPQNHVRREHPSQYQELSGRSLRQRRPASVNLAIKGLAE